MKQKHPITRLLLLGLGSLGLYAGIIYTPETAHTFQVRSCRADKNVVFNFRLPAVNENAVNLAGFGNGTTLTLNHPQFRFAEPGMPSVQSVQCLVQIPDQGAVDVIVNGYESKVINHVNLAPTQYVAPVGLEFNAPYIINRDVYATNAFYPGAVATLDGCEIMRELRVAVVNINPLRYNPVTRQLELITRATITVRPKTDTRGQNELKMADRALTPSFFPLYENVINFDPTRFQVRNAPGCYLFIGSNSNLEAIQELMNWKKQKGFVVKTAVPGKDDVPTDAAGLDTWIKEAYANWNPKPEYVLLVGGEAAVPTIMQKFGIGPMQHDFPADIAYAFIGNSKTPSMHLGRMTGNKAATEDDPAVLKYIAWKTLRHDKEPIDGAWRNKGFVFGCHSAGIKDNKGVKLQLDCNAKIGKQLTIINGTDKASTEFPTVMTGDDFVRYMNEGVSLVTYMGHGNYNIWGNMKFTYKDMPKLKNGEKFPISLSIACLTGDWTGKHCLYEQFLDEGSMEDPKGMVSVFGFTSYSNDGQPNDKVPPGITSNALANMFQKNIYKIGPAVTHAMQFAHMGCDSKAAVIFGCPEVEVYTLGELMKIKAEHSPVKAGDFSMQVTADGNPLANAMVGITHSSTFELLGSAYTDASGKANLTLKDARGADVAITITGHNCRPEILQVKGE